MISGDPTVHGMDNVYHLNNIFHDFAMNLLQNRFMLGFSVTFEIYIFL